MKAFMLRDREVADILGDLCDGIDVPLKEREAALVALYDTVVTSDKGKRLYYLDVNTVALDHVDTAECIWSVAADGLLRLADNRVLVDFADEAGTYREGFLKMTLICDLPNLERIQNKWMQDSDSQRQLMWQKLLERVIEPLRKCSNYPTLSS
jgi:hypothetical protein